MKGDLRVSGKRRKEGMCRIIAGTYPFKNISFKCDPLKFTWIVSYLEEGNATHSSILAWRILWTEEPGGLLSIGLHRVGHD